MRLCIGEDSTCTSISFIVLRLYVRARLACALVVRCEADDFVLNFLPGERRPLLSAKHWCS